MKPLRMMSHIPLARALAVAAVCALTLGLVDLWAYHRTIHVMERQLASLQEACQKHGTRLSVDHITQQGWPFGASLSLSHVHLLTQEGDIHIGGASPAFTFGGHWGQWLWALLHNTTPPLHSDGESVLRLVYHEKDLTLFVQKPQLTPSSTPDGPHILHIHADAVRFTSEATPMAGALSALEGQLYWNTHASPEQSALAVTLTAQQLFLTQPHIPLHHPLTHLRLTAAVPGCRSLFEASQLKDCSVRLHDLSTDIPLTTPPPVHLSFAGKISLPEGNGTLTAQLFHWRESFLQLLDAPVSQQQLSPAMVEALRHFLIPSPESPSSPSPQPDHPLSMSVSLKDAMPTGLSREKLRMIQHLLSHAP